MLYLSLAVPSDWTQSANASPLPDMAATIWSAPAASAGRRTFGADQAAPVAERTLAAAWSLNDASCSVHPTTAAPSAFIERVSPRATVVVIDAGADHVLPFVEELHQMPLFAPFGSCCQTTR